jgi:hypothetical protein
MVTDQNHSSNSAPNEQEVFRYEKIANRIADMHSALSKKMGALNEKIDNYYSEYRKSVKRLERDVRTVESELAIQDDCVDRDTVDGLIQEIVPLLVRKKSLIKNNPSSSSSESSEESDSAGTIVKINGKKMLFPHKQRRKVRPRKVKWLVV